MNGFSTSEDTKCLSVRMLGGFELFYEDEQLTDKSNRSHKMWNLLAYLITYHKRQITQSEFIETLWGDDNNTNPANALKTLFSRLRTFLEPISSKTDSLILSSRGGYHWNTNLTYELDVELFERYCREASDTTLPNDKRIALYVKAIHLYRGDFLPKLKDELWVIPLTIHYHSLFIESSKALAKILDQENMYEEMILYCTRALQFESYDEALHCSLISAFIKHGNRPAALQHYKQATDILYKTISIQPSEELRNLYLSLMKSQTELETNLSIVQQQLKESKKRKGAFVCEYGIFKEIYRLEARYITRTNGSIYIAMMTINQDNEIPPLEILNDAMKELLTSIINCVRGSDTVSKYSGAQYIIMLSCINNRNSTFVMERIIKDYYQRNKKSILQIKYMLSKMLLD